jgi:hypothetical protein
MSIDLFYGEQPENFILEVKYDGPSFQGMMEIGALGNEILSFEICLRKIISALNKFNKIKLNNSDYELTVEAFENNCFKKKIKLIVKTLEKNPATTQAAATLIAGAFAIIVIFIPNNSPKEIKELSPDLIAKVHDQVQLQLISDPEFLQNLSNIIKPLSTEGDAVCFKKPIKDENQTVSISYSQKECFLSVATNEEAQIINIGFDEIYGKIISMDIDAIRNQIDFKVSGAGERIHCSLSEKMNINEYTYLLGKWVTISGQVSTKKGKIYHVDVEKIIEDKNPPALVVQSNTDMDN